MVKAKFASEGERQARQQRLNAAPPNPGSILVCDESEEWSVINPQLDSKDAEEDGLALKKMIAAGVGIPLHFLAEPESATRTTAEAAGGPTFRHFEQRQNYFLWIIHDLLEVVINRRAMVDQRISKMSEIDIAGCDISARDNLALGMAASNVMSVFSVLRDRKLIDDAEMMRMIYKFAGETEDVRELIAEGKAAPDPEIALKNKYPSLYMPAAYMPNVRRKPTTAAPAKGAACGSPSGNLPEDFKPQNM